MKVAVVSGGFSEEHQMSRKSGKCVADALAVLNHTVVMIEYNEHLIGEIKKEAPDAVFHMVQGKYHGDGTVQALLQLAGVPYVGSRPFAAALINNKILCKKLWRAALIPTPEFFEYGYNEYKNDTYGGFLDKVRANSLTLPVVVKPPTQGSRFGIIFLKCEDDFAKMEESFRYDDILLVERYVEGRFITQGVFELNGAMTALPPVEIIDESGSEFKLFALPGGSAARPHDLTPEEVENISRMSIEAALLAGASGFTRLDYHLSGGVLYLLEINAVPGLVPGYSSMCDCAKAAGYSYESLIGILLAAAK